VATIQPESDGGLTVVVVLVVAHLVFLAGLTGSVALLITTLIPHDKSDQPILTGLMAVVGGGVSALILALGPVVQDASPAWWPPIAALLAALLGAISGLLIAELSASGTTVNRCITVALLAFLTVQIVFYWVGLTGDVDVSQRSLPALVFVLASMGAFAMKHAFDHDKAQIHG